MFAFTADPDTLLTAFNSVGVLVDECRLRVSENGITATAVDDANVGMVDMTVTADAFQSFEGDEYLIGFPVERFTDIVNTLSKSDGPIHAHLDEQTRSMEIEKDGLSFTASLTDVSNIRKEPDLPDLTLATNITLDAEQFKRIITATGMLSNHVALGSQADTGEFYGYSKGDVDEVEVVVPEDDYTDGSVGDTHSLFSVDYLDRMTRTLPDDSQVTVQVGNEFPLLIEFADAADNISVQYVLAPRIQSH